MNTPQRFGMRPTVLMLWVLGGLGLCLVGCGGNGGAWLWWLTNPSQKIKAEYTLGKERLALLIDDDKGWLPKAAIRPLLAGELAKQLDEHEVNRDVVSYDTVVRLRQKEPKFEELSAREIGQRLKGRNAEELYQLLGRLEEIDEDMPAFEGSDEERRALAAWLARLGAGQEEMP